MANQNKLLGIPCLVGKIKFKLLFHGPLADMYSGYTFPSQPMLSTNLAVDCRCEGGSSSSSSSSRSSRSSRSSSSSSSSSSGIGTEPIPFWGVAVDKQHPKMMEPLLFKGFLTNGVAVDGFWPRVITNYGQVQDILLGLTGARTMPRVFVDGQCIGGGNDGENEFDQTWVVIHLPWEVGFAMTVMNNCRKDERRRYSWSLYKKKP